MGGKNSKGTSEEILRQPGMQPTANTGFSQKPVTDAANCQPWIWPTANCQQPAPDPDDRKTAPAAANSQPPTCQRNWTA